MADRARLDSWKEIAGYLGRDVRTVIRWERQRGLPVHRVAGGKLARVFAYPAELDQWLTRGSEPADLEPESTADILNEPGETYEPEAPGAVPSTAVPDVAVSAPELMTTSQRPVSSRTLIGTAVTAAVVVAAIGAVVAWAIGREPAAPRQLSIAGNEIVARDGSGQVLWAHAFESRQAAQVTERWSHVGDFDDDGRTDVFANLQIGHPSEAGHGELIRFAADGRLLWSFSAFDRLTFRGEQYGPPWAPAEFALYRAGSAPRIAVALHHYTWWPGLLVTLDAQGRRLETFVNSGWIRDIKGSRDGRSLFIAGVSNSHQAYFFAVLDAHHPGGRSPEAPGSEFECRDCPNGQPRHYFVLPRTDVGGEAPFPSDGPVVQTFEDGTVLVHTHESPSPNVASAIYEFSPEFALRGARFSDSFWEWHRQLEHGGKLRHRADECPERRGIEVQHWTPAEGWQPQTLAVK